MAEQETLLARKRGPKPTGKGTQVVVRVHARQLDAIDAWIASHPDAQTRPEAVRRLIDIAFEHTGPRL